MNHFEGQQMRKSLWRLKLFLFLLWKCKIQQEEEVKKVLIAFLISLDVQIDYFRFVIFRFEAYSLPPIKTAACFGVFVIIF